MKPNPEQEEVSGSDRTKAPPSGPPGGAASDDKEMPPAQGPQSSEEATQDHRISGDFVESDSSADEEARAPELPAAGSESRGMTDSDALLDIVSPKFDKKDCM